MSPISELESYDCRTTTASPVISTSTSVEVSSSEFVTQTSSSGNQSLCTNPTQNEWNENCSLRFENDYSFSCFVMQQTWNLKLTVFVWQTWNNFRKFPCMLTFSGHGQECRSGMTLFAGFSSLLWLPPLDCCAQARRPAECRSNTTIKFDDGKHFTNVV